MVRLRYHYFANLNEIIDLGNYNQWLVTFQKDTLHTSRWKNTYVIFHGRKPYYLWCSLTPPPKIKPESHQSSRYNLITNLEKIQGTELPANSARGHNRNIQTVGTVWENILFYATKMYKENGGIIYMLGDD